MGRDDKITAADVVEKLGARKAREVLGLDRVTVDVTPSWRAGNKIGFTIPGTPIGAPRQTQRDKWAQRPCVVAYREWKDLARQCAGELPPVNQILMLSWVAYFVPPISWSKAKRQDAIYQKRLHRSKPDRDNIDKALLDALFSQDSGIADGRITKRWDAVARLEVTIEIRDGQE